MRKITSCTVCLVLGGLWLLGTVMGMADTPKRPKINLIAIGYDMENNPKAQKMLQEMTQAVKDSGAVGETIFAGKEEDHLDLAMGQAMNLATGAAKVAPPQSMSKDVHVLPAPPMDNLLFAGFRGRNGQTFKVRLIGQTNGQVWGSDVYADRSHPATAAVHAGVLRPGEEGVVSITILPGRSTYQGSSRNGVTSQNWDDYPGSFSFGQK